MALAWNRFFVRLRSERIGFNGKLAYLTMLKQSNPPVCERHQDFPTKESDFDDLGFVVHAVHGIGISCSQSVFYQTESHAAQ